MSTKAPTAWQRAAQHQRPIRQHEAASVPRTLTPDALVEHLDRLYRAAWALCGSREDAEDLVQETCAKMLKKPRLLRSEDDFGYLCGRFAHLLQHPHYSQPTPHRDDQPLEDIEDPTQIPIPNPKSARQPGGLRRDRRAARTVPARACRRGCPRPHLPAAARSPAAPTTPSSAAGFTGARIRRARADRPRPLTCWRCVLRAGHHSTLHFQCDVGDDLRRLPVRAGPGLADNASIRRRRSDLVPSASQTTRSPRPRPPAEPPAAILTLTCGLGAPIPRLPCAGGLVRLRYEAEPEIAVRSRGVRCSSVARHGSFCLVIIPRPPCGA